MVFPLTRSEYCHCMWYLQWWYVITLLFCVQGSRWIRFGVRASLIPDLVFSSEICWVLCKDSALTHLWFGEPKKKISHSYQRKEIHKLRLTSGSLQLNFRLSTAETDHEMFLSLLAENDCASSWLGGSPVTLRGTTRWSIHPFSTDDIETLFL